MQTECSYCQEPFLIPSRPPSKLACAHIFCSNCIKFFKSVKYSNKLCPFDNIKIDFSQVVQCEETLQYLKKICSEHSLEIYHCCKEHLCLLCEKCLINHEACQKTQGNYGKFLSEMNETIGKSKLKNDGIMEIIKVFEENTGREGLIWIADHCKEEIARLKDLKKKFRPNNTVELPNENTIEKVKIETQVISNLFIEKIEKSPAHSEEGIPNILVNNEIKNVRKSCMAMQYFIDSKIVEEVDKVYTAYFENIDNEPWKVKGFGISAPISPEGFVFIPEMSVSYDETTFVYTNQTINYVQGKITEFIAFTKPLIVKQFTRIYFYIQFIGVKCHLFFEQVGDDCVRALDTDEGMLNDEFPVLYLSYNLLKKQSDIAL